MYITTANTAINPNDWVELEDGMSSCSHNPKEAPLWHGALYHCPKCQVMLIAGAGHPSDAVTKILLHAQNIGINAKSSLAKKYPKDPDMESWLRNDDEHKS